MASRPILFTVRYPFGSTESFVRTDLDAIVERFGSVEVVPALAATGLPDSEQRARPVPDGVLVNESLAARPLVPLDPVALPSIARDLRRLAPTETAALLKRPSALASRAILHRSLGSAARAARAASWLRARLDPPAAGVRPLVICYWANSEAIGAALVRREREDVRLACRVHGGDVERERQPGGHLPHRRVLYEQVDLVGAISERGRALVLAEGVDASRVAVHRLGTDAIPEDAVVRDAITPGAPITIASCSSNDPVKRVGLVAAAIAAFAREEPERRVRWLHVGLDRAALAAATSRDGFVLSEPGAVPSNLVVDAAGRVPHDALLARYRDERVAIFVNASSSEGVPVSVMEALGVGVPVVATNAGATAEIVDDAVGALLPVESSARELGAAIDRVLERHPSCAAAARQRWRDRCRSETHGAAWADALSDLVEGATRTHGA